jgi:hypothetical protein
LKPFIPATLLELLTRLYKNTNSLVICRSRDLGRVSYQ